MKSFAILLFVVSVCAANEDFRRLDAIYQEQPCISEGGICTIAADCPKGSLAKKTGLCPEQRASGVECCYGLSVKETRCAKHGGICRSDYCNPRVQFARATDCSPNETCCILVD